MTEWQKHFSSENKRYKTIMGVMDVMEQSLQVT